MPVWSTHRPGDPRSVGHAIPEDFHGRPSPPLCGLSTHGLWFRAWTAWEQVPEAQRCPRCSDVLP